MTDNDTVVGEMEWLNVVGEKEDGTFITKGGCRHRIYFSDLTPEARAIYEKGLRYDALKAVADQMETKLRQWWDAAEQQRTTDSPEYSEWWGPTWVGTSDLLRDYEALGDK